MKILLITYTLIQGSMIATYIGGLISLFTLFIPTLIAIIFAIAVYLFVVICDYILSFGDDDDWFTIDYKDDE